MRPSNSSRDRSWFKLAYGVGHPESGQDFIGPPGNKCASEKSIVENSWTAENRKRVFHAYRSYRFCFLVQPEGGHLFVGVLARVPFCMSEKRIRG